MRVLRIIVCAVLAFQCVSCSGQVANQRTSQRDGTPLRVEEMAGGPVVTNLGYGIQVNKGSTLQRRWYVLNDDSAPLQVSQTGVNTIYESRQYSGDYRFRIAGSATSKEPLAAYEIRFLLFDVFGQHLRTLSATQVSDCTGQFALKDMSWYAGENDVSELLTVVSFVAHARTPDGRIWSYDTGKLLHEIERIKVKLTEKELVPDKERTKKSAE